jgi:uncharacterized membrane protein YesL
MFVALNIVPIHSIVLGPICPLFLVESTFRNDTDRIVVLKVHRPSFRQSQENGFVYMQSIFTVLVLVSLFVVVDVLAIVHIAAVVFANVDVAIDVVLTIFGVVVESDL